MCIISPERKIKLWILTLWIWQQKNTKISGEKIFFVRTMQAVRSHRFSRELSVPLFHSERNLLFLLSVFFLFLTSACVKSLFFDLFLLIPIELRPSNQAADASDACFDSLDLWSSSLAALPSKGRSWTQTLSSEKCVLIANKKSWMLFWTNITDNFKLFHSICTSKSILSGFSF